MSRLTRLAAKNPKQSRARCLHPHRRQSNHTEQSHHLGLAVSKVVTPTLACQAPALVLGRDSEQILTVAVETKNLWPMLCGHDVGGPCRSVRHQTLAQRVGVGDSDGAKPS